MQTIMCTSIYPVNCIVVFEGKDLVPRDFYYYYFILVLFRIYIGFSAKE